MKKVITVMVIFGLICAVAPVAADDLMIARELEIEGKGVIIAELRVDTGADHPAIKLGEDLSTLGGGYSGLSSVSYSSSFDVGMYNTTGNATSDLGYISRGHITNAKRSLYSSNYVIGSIMGIKTIGNTEQNIEIFTDNGGMGADFSGKILGKLRISNKVVDMNNYHIVIVSDTINIAGNYRSWN
jgi:hypothetical protein